MADCWKRTGTKRKSTGDDWSKCCEGFEGFGANITQGKQLSNKKRRSLNNKSLTNFEFNDEDEEIFLNTYDSDEDRDSISKRKLGENTVHNYQQNSTNHKTDSSYKHNLRNMPHSKHKAESFEPKNNIWDDEDGVDVDEDEEESRVELISSEESVPRDENIFVGQKPLKTRSKVELKKSEWSPEIESVSQSPPNTPPSASQSQNISQSSRVKAGDWVKSLAFKTPTKDDQMGSPSYDDSAKKKMRYARDGLAERLTRLVQREKSAQRIWHHNLEHGLLPSQERAQGVCLSVVRCETIFSMKMAHCKILNTDDSLESLAQDPEYKWVLFSLGMKESKHVQVGSKVTIYPPWHELTLKNSGRNVVLSINHMTIDDLSQRSSPVATSQLPRQTLVRSVWRCPCVSALIKLMLIIDRVSEGLQTMSSLSDAQLSLTNAGNEHEDSPIVEKSLHSVPSTSAAKQEKQQLNNFSSISFALSNTTEDSMEGLCFVAYVHRICTMKEGSKVKNCALVEDKEGVMAQILIPYGSHTKKLIGGDRKMCQFSGLCVKERITRCRNRSLFTMLDLLWSGRKAETESQESESSLKGDNPSDDVYENAKTSNNMGRVFKNHRRRKLKLDTETLGSCSNRIKTVPNNSDSTSLNVNDKGDKLVQSKEKVGYCYILKEDVMCCGFKAEFVDDDKDIVFLTKETLHTYKHEDSSKGESDVRVTLCGKSIFLSKSDQKPHMLYISPYCPPDSPSSNQMACYKVDVALCGVKLQELEGLLGNVVLCKDVLCTNENDTFESDEYSSIEESPVTCPWFLDYTQANWSYLLRNLQEKIIQLPNFDTSISVNSLCRLTGKIEDVDEDSCAWEECMDCAEDKIMETENGEMYCSVCKKTVTNLKTRMSMIVFVISLPSCTEKLKVKLLESTSEGLLSGENNTEGYDPECVTGKQITNMTCIVQDDGNNTGTTYLEEVQLSGND